MEGKGADGARGVSIWNDVLSGGDVAGDVYEGLRVGTDDAALEELEELNDVVEKAPDG